MLPGTSDIDFAAITRERAEDAVRRSFESWCAQVSLKYRNVFAVDVDLYGRDEIESNAAVKLIIETDSVTVFGSPQFEATDRTVAASELGRLWNIAVDQIAPWYERTVQQAVPERLAPLSRVVGKDILKCWRARLITEKGVFEQSMPSLFARLKVEWPQHRRLFDELWSLYLEPTNERDRILEVLRFAIKSEPETE